MLRVLYHMGVAWRLGKTSIFKQNINNQNNNMKKLPDLKELPENMLEIKENMSGISLQELIDNFYVD